MEKKEKKEEKTYKFTFSGKGKGGYNNKVLEKIKKPEKECSCKLTHPNLNICYSFRWWNFMNNVSL